MTARGDDPNSLRNEVFTALFDANWAAVRHHIECVVVDDDEVAELVSEVFVEAWSRLDPAHPRGKPWLLRLTDRVLRSRARHTADRPAVTEAVHAGVSEGAISDCPATHAEVLTALAGLRTTERRIIMLTYWDGLTAAESAESMGVSRPGADRILRRAQRKLRRGLGLEGEIGGADD